LDLRWFEDVIVLLEERNLTRAAARRNITQPAFSRRIRTFEDWLGTPLLERKANSVRIHPALLASEDEIKSLIQRIQELRNRIKSFKPEDAHVTVTTQHALLFSAFPDIAALTQEKMPTARFRLRAVNRTECVSIFLHGEASILLCYEDDGASSMPFDQSIFCDEWGKDRLVPVIGGRLKYRLSADGTAPDSLPAIVYPEQSYFGELLTRSGCPFSSTSRTQNPRYETAYSAGIKEMVAAGLGISWLPMSMVYQQIESGDLMDLSNHYGSLPLRIVFYTNSMNAAANSLRSIWRVNGPAAISAARGAALVDG
jgi:DNA-binding transcriptional LysR family regulator